MKDLKSDGKEPIGFDPAVELADIAKSVTDRSFSSIFIEKRGPS